MSIRIDGTNTTANPGITGSDADTGLQFGTNEVSIVTGGSTRATVDSSGKLGVATTSPQSKLSVGNAASTDDGLSITFTGDDTVVAKYFANTSSGEVTIGGVATNYFPTFYSSGSEAMRLDTSGNLGVGTASPNHRLTLHNSGTGTFDALNITSGLTNANGLQLGISSASDVFFWHTANGAIQFATNNVERMRVTNNGITFNGDTAAANALDDYEEGDFTPTYSSGLTSPSYTGTGGHYTKIGNLVTVTIRIRATGTNAGSHLQIAGLPFTTSGKNEGSFSFGYSDNISGSSGMPVMHLPENGTSIQFYNQDGSNWDGNSGNGITGRTLHIRGFYFA